MGAGFFNKEGNILSGRSISVVFQNAGEVSIENTDTGFCMDQGLAAHAVVKDERTGKEGHIFLVRDFTHHTNVSEPTLVEESFVFSVPGASAENIILDDVYLMPINNLKEGATYADATAMQLLKSAEIVKTDLNSKELVFTELDEISELNI